MSTVQTDFSRRERQIVGALCEAKAVKEIARELDLSVNTVKDYLKTIYRKAQVHSARELMRQVAAAEPPAADAALAQLLLTAQRLSEAATPQEVLAQLHAAIRHCTRARRVSYWHWLRNGGQLVLAAEAAGPRGGALLRVDTLVRQLRERGWARLERQEMGGVEGRELAAQGLGGEVIGVVCAAAARVQVVLAGDPAEGRFAPLDAATIRLLARMSQSSGNGGGLTALRATA